MAAPTFAVPMFTVSPTEEVSQYPLPAVVQTFYPGEMLGLDVNGYAAKFDDTQSLLFLGINAESVRIDVVSADAAGDKKIKVQRPKEGFAMTIAAAVLTDGGKKCYAKFSNEVTYANTGVYGNYAGTVKEYINATTVMVQPQAWGDKYCGGVTRTMAATGAQSLTKWDLNKTILIPNSAALTVTLPAVANTQEGDYIDFQKTTAAAFTATIQGNGAETINGANTSTVLAAQYNAMRLISTGTAWIILAKN